MVSRNTHRLRISLAVALAMAASGCGPFGYLKKVTQTANRAVAAAKAAGAEEYAPYEYWGAVSYLEQAKVLMAYSEYERSFDYGERAAQLAEEAERKARTRGTGDRPEAAAGGTGDRPEAAAGGAGDRPKAAAGGADSVSKPAPQGAELPISAPETPPGGAP
jgi:hypothetical protein